MDYASTSLVVTHCQFVHNVLQHIALQKAGILNTFVFTVMKALGNLVKLGLVEHVQELVLSKYRAYELPRVWLNM